MALEMLKMSIKYDIPMMQNYCEEYLVKYMTCSKMELLEMGDQQLGNEKLMVKNKLYLLFNLTSIKETCIGHDDSKEFMQRFETRFRNSCTIKRKNKEIVGQTIGGADE